MKLSVNKAITGALGFSLRHAVPFYLLGLGVSLPSYLHSFLPREIVPGVPRPWWETELAVPAIEAILGGIMIAIMVHGLRGDRRGERLTVWAGLATVAPRLPTVIAVSLVVDLGVTLIMAAADSLVASALVIAAPMVILGLFLWLVFCVAVPCAAVDNAGIIHCLERSVALTAGSRPRIIAVFLLSILPVFAVAAAAILLSEGRFSAESLSPLWIWLVTAAAEVYAAALVVVLHEALVILKDGAGAGTLATVFD